MAVRDVTLSGTHLAPALVSPTGGGAAVTLADVASQAHAAASLAGTPDYLTIAAATQVITRALINLTTHVTGSLPIANGGTGAGTAADAFTAIKQVASTTATGVVELATSAEVTAGLVIQASDTRIHAAATVSGTPNYITLTGQDIVRELINLTSHVTGLLPNANVANLATVTQTTTTRTNTSADRNQWVRWTSTSAKTFTITTTGKVDGDVWQGMNAATAGNLTFAQGAGFAIRGLLIFAPGKSYTLRFSSTTGADLIGGT